MKMATTYQLGMDLESLDLPLFGDWLQGWPGAEMPISDDLEDEVVQDWTSALIKGETFESFSAHSILHNSVCADSGEACSSSNWSLTVGNREQRLSVDDDLKTFVSPEDLLLKASDCVYDQTEELAQVVEDPLDVLDVFVDGGSIAAAAEVQYNIGDLPFDCGISLSTESKSDIFTMSSDISYAETDHMILPLESVQSTIDVTQHQSEAGIMQQVPSSPSNHEDLALDLDDYCVYESLTDPSKVCNILQRLCHSISGNIVDKSQISLHVEPVLSPMSSEDIESILSADERNFSPQPARSITEDELSTISEEYKQFELITKSDDHVQVKLLTTEMCIIPENKRQKKKEQNKSAAYRYRQKKREEKGVVHSEVDKLQMKNSELKARVEELNREIGYLKGLLDEINKQ